MRLQPGTLLQGDRYRIIDILGQGGFGITYLAEQVMAERKVCIKEFFPKEYYNRDEDSRSISLGSQGSAEIMDLYKAKFIKEAKTIAKLDHPNIIHIHDVFTENNTAYYVMEYIDGESLSALVKERGALSEDEAVNYIKQVAAALSNIHEQRIMHLDIKPANIMLRKNDGKPVLIDFGLSKQYDADGNQTSSTPVGISAGYAPMEQYKQGGVKEFSPETDIYSLGATLYYLVTGVVPPQAAAIVDDGLPELPAHLSANVRNAIERSMEVQRKKRPHSMSEFVALLNDSKDVTTTPISVPTPENEATVIGIQASATEEETVITTSTPKAEAPKKEWTPKYSTEKPKKSDEPKKKKSRWWMWLLGLLLIGGGAYFIIGANSSKNTQPTEEEKIAAVVEEMFEEAYTAAVNGDFDALLEWDDEMERLDDYYESSPNTKVAWEEAYQKWEEQNPDKCELISAVWDEGQTRRWIEDTPVEYISGCECVDMGLSVKWAAYNVGAKYIGDYGSYFTYNEAIEFANSCDARLPSAEEFQELIYNCEWRLTKYYDEVGYVVRSTINGHSIFLPAAGAHNGFSWYNKDLCGYYWSSDRWDKEYAYHLYFDSEYHNPNAEEYYPVDSGHSVRLVVE